MGVVEFRRVTCQIDRHHLLRDFSLSIETGERLVLLGRSGSGKTTALKLINALRTATEGEVAVEGRSLREWDLRELRRRIGYVIQEGGLFPHWTVARNVGITAHLAGCSAPAVAARVDELMRRMDLAPELATRFPSQLSGGQRQRVGIARALAARPPILLFDEPFAALDPMNRRALQDHLLRLAEAEPFTLVFVTHDVREALRIATRIAVLDQGQLAGVFAPAEFAASHAAAVRDLRQTGEL
jgi:osmoprotectant transport system ATP-binding protein